MEVCVESSFERRGKLSGGIVAEEILNVTTLDTFLL
jgi:hypothetical protein